MQPKELEDWPILEGVNTSNCKKIFVLGSTALMLKNDGKIYGIGRYSYILGKSAVSPKSNLSEITSLRKFKDFTTNGEHVLAISEEGFLYSWGSGENGQLGRDGERDAALEVKKVFGVRIKMAVCGSKFSCVLTEEGRVFEWGIYGFNELVFEINKDLDKLDEAEENEVIVTLHATQYYPMMLTESGKVFVPSFSRATNKCNLHLHAEKMYAIEGALKNKKIEMVTSGRNFVFALTNAGEIFMWALLPLYGCSCNGLPKANHIAKKIGRIVKIWASTSDDVLVAVNNFGTFYSIVWHAVEMLPSISKVNFSSASKYFGHHRMVLQGPVYDQTNVDFKVEDNAYVLNEWRRSYDAAFNNKEDNDIKFLIDGGIIYAHRAILSIQSSYMNAILKNDWKENSENNQITIKEYTYPTYLRFIRYLYTGKIEISSHEDNLELLKLAHEYVEKPLLDMCKKMVIEGLNVENAFPTYNIAYLLGLEDVREACKTHIGGNLEEVLLSEAMSNQDETLFVRCVRDLVCTKNIIGEGKKDNSN